MQTLVLHTSSNGPLLHDLAGALLLQRRQLRQRGIGLRFPGPTAPRQQWESLASAMAAGNEQAWLAALRWRRLRPRDTWLCAKGFHRIVVRERSLNRWRDWLEKEQLALVVAMHLLPPRQQSWRRFVESTLRLEPPTAGDGDVDPACLYNDVYDTLIETAGVRGSRFLLHGGPASGGPESGEPAMCGPDLLEGPCWPGQGGGTPADLRAFGLSLALTRQLQQPLEQAQRQRLQRAVRAAAAQLPPLGQAQAEALAAEAGWRPPEGAALSSNLERFARRVWGTTWPLPAGQGGAGATAQGDPSGAVLELAGELGRDLAVVARQLLEHTSS